MCLAKWLDIRLGICYSKIEKYVDTSGNNNPSFAGGVCNPAYSECPSNYGLHYKTAAMQATRSKSIKIRGEFLYWTEQKHVSVRDRNGLPNAARKLGLIAPEEIQMAIKQIVSDAFGIERDDLSREVCKLFGFVTVSTNMRQKVEEVINEMIEHGDLREKDSSLLLD